MATLTVEKLTKRYGPLEVLRSVDLTVDDGELLVLLGPSGCGKSTLLNMIAGLDAISSGRVLLDGREINDVPPKDRDMAMVFQSHALYPNMTVARNIGFNLEMCGVPKPEREAAILETAERLKIEHLLHRKPSQLSGGQRQRVAMGRAMIRRPKVFLFDEPLSSLDAALRVDLRSEIKRLHRRMGVTTVYVTHDQGEAMALADRLAVMRDGEIRQLASPREVYDRPADLFVAGFIGSPPMNTMPASVAIENGRPGLVVRADTGAGWTTIFLPLGPNAGLGAETAGREVILGLRPEAFRRATPGDAGTEIRCRVASLETTGADVLARIDLGPKGALARLRPSEAPEEGETIRLILDMNAAVLFDPVSGRRL